MYQIVFDTNLITRKGMYIHLFQLKNRSLFKNRNIGSKLKNSLLEHKTFKAVVVMRWEPFGIVHNCLGLIIQPAFMHQF